MPISLWLVEYSQRRQPVGVWSWESAWVSCAIGFSILLVKGGELHRIVSSEFQLRAFDPCIEFFLGNDDHLDRHEAVGSAAEDGALAVENAFFIGLEPGFVEAA